MTVSIEREELGGGGLGAGDVQDEALRGWRRKSRCQRTEAVWGAEPGSGRSRLCAPESEVDDMGACRGGRAGEGKVGFAGDADCAADEPGNVGGESRFRLRGVEVRSDAHRDGEDDFVLVTEVHQRAEGQPLGRRELQRIGRDAFGELPGDGGRLAGVAGVDPVDVPALFHAEVQAGGKGFAGVDLCWRHQERDGQVRGRDGERRFCPRAMLRQDQEGQGEKREQRGLTKESRHQTESIVGCVHLRLL